MCGPLVCIAAMIHPPRDTAAFADLTVNSVGAHRDVGQPAVCSKQRVATVAGSPALVVRQHPQRVYLYRMASCCTRMKPERLDLGKHIYENRVNLGSETKVTGHDGQTSETSYLVRIAWLLPTFTGIFSRSVTRTQSYDCIVLLDQAMNKNCSLISISVHPSSVLAHSRETFAIEWR